MARDSSGPKNEPQYAGTGAPADAADLTEVAAYAAANGNRKVLTTIQRTALAGADVWEGLVVGDTTDGNEYRRTGSGWLLLSGKLIGSAGVIAGSAATAGTSVLKQTITGVYSSGAAGRWLITYPVAFPNGLLSTQLTLLNGDVYGAILNFYGSPSLNSATVQVVAISTGAAVPSINPRINLVLEGW